MDAAEAIKAAAGTGSRDAGRWDYIATMTFHLRREEQAAREPIGFSPV